MGYTPAATGIMESHLTCGVEHECQAKAPFLSNSRKLTATKRAKPLRGNESHPKENKTCAMWE
jgi:hypothetical protein